MAKNDAKKTEEQAASTDVAVTKPGALVAGGFDYGTEGGAGFENTSHEDLSIPFISVLQANSPEVEEMEGAKAGMLFNTVTKELIDSDKGLIFMPCHADTSVVEWIPRDSGGGFVGQHEMTSEVVKGAIARNGGNRFGGLKTEDGKNDLVETHYVYGLILDDEGKQPEGFAIIAFSSTKIKPKKDWFTAMYTLKGRPPLFANRARLKTIKQKNEHGTFYNFAISPFGTVEGKPSWKGSLINPVTEGELLAEGKSFRDIVISGKAKVDFSKSKENGTGGSGQVDEDGKEIPF